MKKVNWLFGSLALTALALLFTPPRPALASVVECGYSGATVCRGSYECVIFGTDGSCWQYVYYPTAWYDAPK